MSAIVNDIIGKLRDHFGVKTDAELAAKLRVGASAISGWRARNKIPKRYLELLTERTSKFTTSPHSDWTDLEKAAFNLGIYRWAQVMTDLSSQASSAEKYSLVNLGLDHVERLAHEAIKEFQQLSDKTNDPLLAMVLLISKDNDNRDKMLKRTKKILSVEIEEFGGAFTSEITSL